MTLADFLSSGNLVSLLKDEDHTSKESKIEKIIMFLSYIDVLPEREKNEHLKKLSINPEDWKLAKGFLYDNVISSIRLKDYKIKSQRPIFDFYIYTGLSKIFYSLDPSIQIKIYDALCNVPVEGFHTIISLLDYYLNVGNYVGQIGPLSEHAKRPFTFEPYFSDTTVGYTRNSILAFVSLTFLYTIFTLFNEMLRKRKLRLDKLDFSLEQAKGTSEEKKNHSLEEIETLRLENIILSSDITKRESKKQAQAQKINEKISELRLENLLDDEVLITMVDKYLIDFFDQKKIDDFKTIKTQHRSTIKQDENHHNKTHLNLISHFFEGLEVNGLF